MPCRRQSGRSRCAEAGPGALSDQEVVWDIGAARASPVFLSGALAPGPVFHAQAGIRGKVADVAP
ncbi:protein of unknown function [Cupriavidus taiwanensis]|nr:protein of unknown function [Cupriavidus taiwanensis]